MADRKRVLTGVKPTGVPHIGNYLGAIRPALELTKTHDAFLFIADLHALTTRQDPNRVTEDTYSVAATWLACGLDPAKSTFYKQSDIPEVATLSWILSCFTPFGLLLRAHSFVEALQKEQGGKEDVRKAIKEALTDTDALEGMSDAGFLDINHGVFAYPVLMAADILIMDADVVPVGKDQKQHLEITQEAARKLNHVAGKEVLKIPAAKIDEDVMTVPGLDGRKMSKSYDNTIEIFSTDKQLRKKINEIKTDSTPYGEPLKTEGETVFALYKLFASPEQTAELSRRYAAGKKADGGPFGWGDAKGALHELILDRLGPARKEYGRLMDDKPYIRRLLTEGAEKARVIASATLSRVVDAMGIVR
jgi:tryptophanyl-tRNA synthetase